MEYPLFKGAVVQTAPLFLNAEKTVAKACDIIAEAARHGAQLIAFPEVFIAGYPYWNWLLNPIDGSQWFEVYFKSAITIEDKLIVQLKKAALQHDINVVIGCNERPLNGTPTLYNTNLIINNRGQLIGAHRKLIPTWAEKLTWSFGSGASLRVYDTSVGKLGTLACGENTNTLARFTLLAQGEMVHVANYISLPVAPADYDMANAIKIRASAHSFEGKLFTLVSCSTISEEMLKALEGSIPNVREKLMRKNSAFSGIIGPNGDNVVEPLIDKEGIIYADIDLNTCIQPKQMHDIIGSYNRFDIFKVSVNFQDNPALNEMEQDNKFVNLNP